MLAQSLIQYVRNCVGTDDDDDDDDDDDEDDGDDRSNPTTYHVIPHHLCRV